MKQKLLLIFLCLLAGRIMAQQDSAKAVRKPHFFSDSIAISIFDFAKKNPLFINSLMPNRISRISLSHQLEKGNFVEAQGSTKTNNSSLSSEGSIMLNSLKLYGSFSYNKVFEDSTRFAAQSRNNTSTPYYFGSPANNHYERAIYDFKAMALKDFFTKKISAGVGFDYHIADHYANNDPRGSIKEYQLNTKFLLGYNINKDIQLSAGLNLGYGTEEVVIGYKKSIYFQSTAYPRYVNYLINGYGEPNPKTNNRKYLNNFSRFGFASSLKIANTTFGSFYINATQLIEQQRYNYRDDSAITRLADYDLTKLDLDLLWSKPLFNGTLSTVFNYSSWDGEDFHIAFRAKNYVYTKNIINIKLNYTVPKENNLYNYSIGLKNFSEERLDGITANNIFYKNQLLNANFGFLKYLPRKRSIGVNIGAHYMNPLKDTFSVNSSAVELFTSEVIFHDYLYHTSSRIGGSFGTDYSFPFLKMMQASIKLNLVYTNKMEMKTLDRGLISSPGNNRLFSNISFNLYF